MDKTTAMKHSDGLNVYELVYRRRLQTIMVFRGPFYHEAGKAKGILVMRKTWTGEIWYHRPENCLEWKPIIPTK